MNPQEASCPLQACIGNMRRNNDPFAKCLIGHALHHFR